MSLSRPNQKLKNQASQLVPTIFDWSSIYCSLVVAQVETEAGLNLLNLFIFNFSNDFMEIAKKQWSHWNLGIVIYRDEENEWKKNNKKEMWRIQCALMEFTSLLQSSWLKSAHSWVKLVDNRRPYGLRSCVKTKQSRNYVNQIWPTELCGKNSVMEVAPK